MSSQSRTLTRHNYTRPSRNIRTSRQLAARRRATLRRHARRARAARRTITAWRCLGEKRGDLTGVARPKRRREIDETGERVKKCVHAAFGYPWVRGWRMLQHLVPGRAGLRLREDFAPARKNASAITASYAAQRRLSTAVSARSMAPRQFRIST